MSGEVKLRSPAERIEALSKGRPVVAGTYEGFTWLREVGAEEAALRLKVPYARGVVAGTETGIYVCSEHAEQVQKAIVKPVVAT